MVTEASPRDISTLTPAEWYKRFVYVVSDDCFFDIETQRAVFEEFSDERLGKPEVIEGDEVRPPSYTVHRTRRHCRRFEEAGSKKSLNCEV